MSDPDGLERLFERVRDDVRRERGPRAWLRERATPVRVALVLAVAALSVATPVVLGGVSLDLHASLSVIGMLVLTATAVVLSLRPLHRSPWPRGAWPAALAIAALGSIAVASDGTLGAALSAPCLLLGAVVGAPVLLAGWLVDRAPRLERGLASIAAALTGMLAAQALCPARGLAHLVVDHFGALLVLAALFAVIRRSLPRLTRD